MSLKLKPAPWQEKVKNRSFVLNIILDGVGISEVKEGDAFHHAKKPHFDSIKNNFLYRELFAHGPYVGMPSESDMGNSEVGHNAIGSGVIYDQGAKLIDQSLKSGNLFSGEVWKKLIAQSKNRALHCIALLSDGNVHSHISHLEKITEMAAKEGCKKIFLHALLDGRDTPPRSALTYISQIEKHFSSIEKKYQSTCKIASGGGRMNIVMDRYEADWSMIERGWQTIVEGKGDLYENATDAVTHLRKHFDCDDQYCPPFVIGKQGTPLAPVEDGDGVLLCNFRGDRALEICRAFTQDKVPFKKNKNVDVFFCGMMLYDGDLLIPKDYLVSPPQIKNTMGQYLVENSIKLFAVSETQKYGHVTFFWNGNRSGMFDEKLETYIEVKSDNVPFDQRPWMKAAEITDHTIDLLNTSQYRFGRINYPNGDMVGHTGDFEAARMAIEATDLSLGRLLKTIKKLNGMAIVTADHGNCDEMYEVDKKQKCLKKLDGEYVVKTSHTLNPVPFIIYDPLYNNEYTLKAIEGKMSKAGIANIAATTFELMGFLPPENYEPSLIKWN